MCCVGFVLQTCFGFQKSQSDSETGESERSDKLQSSSSAALEGETIVLHEPPRTPRPVAIRLQDETEEEGDAPKAAVDADADLKHQPDVVAGMKLPSLNVTLKSDVDVAPKTSAPKADVVVPQKRDSVVVKVTSG